MAGLFSKVFSTVLTRNMKVTSNLSRGMKRIAEEKPNLEFNMPGIHTQKFKFEGEGGFEGYLKKLEAMKKAAEAAEKAERKKMLEEILRRQNEFFS